MDMVYAEDLYHVEVGKEYGHCGCDFKLILAMLRV